jgi:hypothetical protein
MGIEYFKVRLEPRSKFSVHGGKSHDMQPLAGGQNVIQLQTLGIGCIARM